MATFSNQQLEKFAVLAVDSATTRFPLTTNIPTGDKGISFDGYIDVMEDTSEKKEAFLGKVPVQVKGTEVKKFSGRTRKFSLEIAHFKNYYKTNGVILFVVEVLKNFETKVFYKQLLPFEIKCILEEYGHQRKRVITLHDLNTTTIYKVCKNFLSESTRQPITLIEHNPFKKENYTSFKMTSLTFDPENGDDITEHDFTFYGVIGDLFVPIGIGRLGDEIKQGIDTVIIDGSESIEVSVEFQNNKEKNKIIITIEESLEIKIENENFRFDILKFRSVEIQLRVLPILIALISGKEIEFQKSGQFKGGNIIDKTILPKINKLYQDFIKLKEAFTILNVDERTEFINESGSLQNSIQIFGDIVVNRDVSKIKESLGDELFLRFNLGGLNFLLFSQSKPTPHYINAFSEEVLLSSNPMLEVRGSDNNVIKRCTTSPYIYLDIDMLARFVNIDFSIIKRSFEKIEPIMEVETFNFINSFCLDCIGTYDKTKRMEFLELAEYIYSLHNDVLSKSDEEVIRLNELQILKRKNGYLSKEEILELMNIKQNTQEAEIQFCTSVLLGGALEATTYFESLPNEYKEKFKTYPIYNLFEALT